MPEQKPIASDQGQQPAVENDDLKAAVRLIEIMGRKLVIALALGSVVGAALLCMVGIFKPTLVPSQVSRFFLCLLTAFLFSVFVFTIYPADYKFDMRQSLKIPFLLVGPGALWIALFLLLWYMFPNEGAVGKVFLPTPGGQNIPYSASWLLRWEPTQPVFYKLKTGGEDNDNPYAPAGFYVEFDSGHDNYQAVIGVGPSKDEIEERYEVTFSRSATTYQVQAPQRR